MRVPRPWHRPVIAAIGGLLPILSGIAFVAALSMHASPLQAAAPSVTIGGPFTLMAADGKTVSDRTYRGKWLLVFFGYTFCPDTCPTVLNQIAIALEKLGPEAAKLQPLFITVDPRRDTPDVLRQYVDSFDPRIVGLTGSPQQIAAVAQAYGAYYAPHAVGQDDGTYLVDHGSYIYLMSPEGAFVQTFDAGTPGDRLADSLRKLMAQPRP